MMKKSKHLLQILFCFMVAAVMLFAGCTKNSDSDSDDPDTTVDNTDSGNSGSGDSGGNTDSGSSNTPAETCTHNWVFTSTTATCVNEGVNNYKCSLCGETKTEHADALGHDYVVVSTTTASCTDDGYTTEQCTRCGSTVQHLSSEATGHTYVDTTLGSGTEGETVKYVCSTTGCGDTYYVRTLDTEVSISGTASTDASEQQSAEFKVYVDKTGVYEVALKTSDVSYTSNAGEQTAAMENTALSNVRSVNFLASDTSYEGGYNANRYYVYLTADEVNTIKYSMNATVTIYALRLELMQETDAVVNFDTANSTINSQNAYKLTRLNYFSIDTPTYTQTVTVTASGYYDISYFAEAKGNSQLWVTFSTSENKITMLSSGLSADLSYWRANGYTTSSGNAVLYTQNLYVYGTASMTDMKEDYTHTNGTTYDKTYYEITNLGDQGSHYIYLEAGTEYTCSVSAATTAWTSSDRLFFGGALFLTYMGGSCPDSHTHDYTTITIDPTCTEAGASIQICAHCGYVGDRTAIVALGHDPEELAGQAATCTQDGYSSRTVCSRCGEILSESETISALDHDYQTSTTGETTKHYCVNGCGDVYYTTSYESGTKSVTGSTSWAKRTLTFDVNVEESGIYLIHLDIETLTNTYASGGNNASMQSSALLGVKSLNYLLIDSTKYMDDYEVTCFTVYLASGDNTLTMELNCTIEITGLLLEYYQGVDGIASAVTLTESQLYANVANDTTDGYTATTIGANEDSTSTRNTARINNQNQYSVLYAYRTGDSMKQATREFYSTLTITQSGYYDISTFAGAYKENNEIYVNISGEGYDYTLVSSGLVNSNLTDGEWESLGWTNYDYSSSGAKQTGNPMLLTKNLYVCNSFGYTEKTGSGTSSVTYKLLDNTAEITSTHYIYLEAGTYTVLVGGVATSEISSGAIYYGGAVFATYVGTELI